MTTIFGSNTRPLPAALKHYFRRASGNLWIDDAGGIEYDPSSGGGSKHTVIDYNGSLGTFGAIGYLTGDDLPGDVSSGSWHTFDPAKASLVIVAARRFIDPYWTPAADPKPNNYAATRFAIGDLNNLGTHNGTTFVAPAGIGLAGGGPFHHARGNHEDYAMATWGTRNSFRIDSAISDAYAGYIDEPDSVNYPPPFEGAPPLPINSFGWKFEYEDYYPYRVSPPAVQIKRDVLLIAMHDPATATRRYFASDIDTGALLIGVNTLNGNGDTLTHAYQPNACMRVINLALYTAQIWEFSGGIPADWYAGSLWTAQRAKTGEKVPYPKWMSLT